METKDIIKELRKKHGYTADQVATGAGIAKSVYPKYESGILNAGVPVLCKLAEFYGVSTDYLLGRKPAKNPLDALSLSDADKFIVQAYINLSPEDRTALVEIIKKIASGADVKVTTDNEKVEIQQEASHRPDIEISQSPKRAIARSKDNPLREAPTPDQLASLTPVPEDSDL